MVYIIRMADESPKKAGRPTIGEAMELEIFKMSCKGMKAVAIAKEKNLAPSTVYAVLKRYTKN